MKNIYLISINIFLIIIIYYFINNFINNFIKKNNVEYFSNNYIENDIYDKEFVDFYEIIYRDYKDIDYDYKIIENKILKNYKNNDIKILIGGSGVGKNCKKFKEKYDNIVGIDNSESMILFSKKTYPNIKFIKGNLTHKNTFEKNNYDIILLDERTLYYNELFNQEKIIKNCFYWLKENSYLIVPIYDPNELQLASRYYSSNYIDDKGYIHGFTYLNDFNHNCYYIKDKENNNEHHFYDKIVLNDGKYRIKKTKLYIYNKEKTYDIILKSGFKQIHIEPIHIQILGGYELAIFKKSNDKL